MKRKGTNDHHLPRGTLASFPFTQLFRYVRVYARVFSLTHAIYYYGCSFFSWFSETQLEDAGEGLHDEVNPLLEALNCLKNCHVRLMRKILYAFSIKLFIVFLASRLQVAEIIKEDLWPDPIKYLYNVTSSFFPYYYCVFITFHLFELADNYDCITGS